MTLDEILAQLGPQEREAVALIGAVHDAATTRECAERILVGQQRYGRLDLAHDPRDWEREAREEDLDGIAYRAFAVVKRRCT